MAKRWYYKDENGNKVPVPQYKIDADDYYTKTMSDSRYYDKSATDTLLGGKVSKTDITQSTGTSETAVMSQKAVSDALSNVYTKAESDARIATKQNVLTAGNGITIAGDVISVDAIPVDDKKFTVWSNPRMDEYVTTFTNFGYNDDGTQKTSGSSTRSWVFRIGNYGHKKVYFSYMNAWMCDGLDESQNMVNPTLLGIKEDNVDISEEHIGKYIVAMSVGGIANTLGTTICRCVQFCDDKTQSELDAYERMLSDVYAGNLIRYAVATSEIDDRPTLEWGSKEFFSKNSRNVLVDIVSRPNIAYECKVVKKLDYLYQGCGRLIEITPLWDTSLVTTMQSVFQMCRSLRYADLSHLDFGAVTDVSFLFRQCIALIEAKLPSMPSVTNCQYIFYGCSSMQSLYLDMPNCNSLDNSFANCTSLHTVEIVDMRKAKSLHFYGCTSLQNVTCVEELPKCTISFSSSSKLTLESVTNIITHLPDLSGEDSKKLTLHAITKSLLTEALIAEATNKNWIIA